MKRRPLVGYVHEYGGFLRGGGSRYVLAPTIFVTARTEDWSWR